jgi:predicted metal-binding membrane protein
MRRMTETGHPHLSSPDRGLAWLAARPRHALWATVLVGAGLGWAALLAMVAGGGMAGGGGLAALGPGMGVFDAIAGFASLPEPIRAGLKALCLPSTGAAWGASDLALVAAMWVTMAFAMMLPTAAPMLRTYADIAETAARKGERAVPVLVLAAGYLTVWIGFAVLATAAQWGLIELRLVTPAMAPASLVLSGTTLVAAGLYQFTPMKNACLTRCRAPFSYFFARWTTAPAAVYRQGLEQGLNCLGCCWALMAVMFAVGVMNLVWIALIGVAMAVEKATSGPWPSRVIGAALVVWGLAMLAASPPGQRLLGAM